MTTLVYKIKKNSRSIYEMMDKIMLNLRQQKSKQEPKTIVIFV